MPVYLDEIHAAVRDRLVANQATLLPIKYQNKTFDPADNPYVEFMLSPVDTEAQGPNSDVLSGIIGFNVYVLPNAGARYPAEEAKKFVQLFPRSDEFNGIRIVNTGTIHRQIDGGGDRVGWKLTPVTIPYEVESCLL